MSVKRWHTTHRILGGKYNVIVVYPARDINSARQMGMRRLERESHRHDTHREHQIRTRTRTKRMCERDARTRTNTQHCLRHMDVLYLYENAGISFSPLSLLSKAPNAS